MSIDLSHSILDNAVMEIRLRSAGG